MPTEIGMPQLSAGIEDAVVVKWLKSEGDRVAKGEVLAEVETDKATLEIEAEVDGKVARLTVGQGARVGVGEIIAILVGDDEFFLPSAAAMVAPPAGNGGVAAEQQSKPAAPVRSPSKDRVFASPLARRAAAEFGINLANLNGSGPRGRIVRTDIDSAMQSAPAAKQASRPDIASRSSAISGIGLHDAVPLSGMRRTIARRLAEAKTTIPHFYLEIDCNVDALINLRQQINDGRDADSRISLNDMMLKAAAVALSQIPDANVIWTEDAILRLRTVDIAVAVSTDGGLYTPVFRDVDRKSLGALSSEVKALAERARAGRLTPDEYQGGGLCVSNLGMYGVKAFSAIINPPQSCILAIGAAELRPIATDQGISAAQIVSCTMSVDHRAVDGVLGAKLLAAFRKAVENPMSMLV